jgi:hypothetical protein
MKMCQPHWEQLRKAIDERGLSGFINKSGEAATVEITSQIHGTEDKDRPYDPLLAANFAIWSNALKCGGLYLMSGGYCPLCELEAHSPAKAEDWINPCTDSIQNEFMAKGWIPASS